MPKGKMKFPPVPGDTPREQFTNLVHHVISVPRTEVDGRKKKTKAKLTRRLT